MENKREKTHAGECFYRNVLEPLGITFEVLRGEELAGVGACKGMAKLANTSFESWFGLRRTPTKKGPNSGLRSYIKSLEDSRKCGINMIGLDEVIDALNNIANESRAEGK